MEVKEFAKIIRELDIETCNDCPFYDTLNCKLHGNICIMDSTVAEGLLQLEEFFKTGEVKEILEEKKYTKVT